MADFRRIPSIEQLLTRPALGHAVAQHGRYVVTQAARYAANELRDELAKGSTQITSEFDATAWLESRTLALARAHAMPSLYRVINATGVIVHTNLGRAPLALEAAETAARIASGYSNLEYELDEGGRGQRHVHAERLLCSLTGAEAALVVNNAAAAALLSLAALAHGREVIVSRGELVEIGGGFRVPEILAQSGALLREVGTTNRTRLSDYAAAINERTALILRVHPSNFQIKGFTERPALPHLAALGSKFGLPVVEDLGSGWLGLGAPPAALAGEPSVKDSLAAGIDLVFFSGDKLLGGPQAGILVGRDDLVSQLVTHPLMRALRVDKLTYAALEATLSLWAEEPSRNRVPVARMLTMTASEIEARVRAIIATVSTHSELECTVADGMSTVGGGSASGSELPTKLLTVSRPGLSAEELANRLRHGATPIVGRVQHDRVVLDLRTVAPDDDAAVADALIALR
jgi:L-seryl-tRNA(Ser) seleniumtransferase